MSRDEAKAILDGSVQYLQRAGSMGVNALMLTTAAGYDFENRGPQYMSATANGAGGNIYVSKDFDEAWHHFNTAADTPISAVEYVSAGEE